MAKRAFNKLPLPRNSLPRGLCLIITLLGSKGYPNVSGIWSLYSAFSTFPRTALVTFDSALCTVSREFVRSPLKFDRVAFSEDPRQS